MDKSYLLNDDFVVQIMGFDGEGSDKVYISTFMDMKELKDLVIEEFLSKDPDHLARAASVEDSWDRNE